MVRTLDILTEIRRDFAQITDALCYLQSLRRFSDSQKEAIDNALQGFSFIVCQYIGEIRKSFGERQWYRLEDIDKPKMDKGKNEAQYGIRPASIIEQINIKARDLNKKLLILPGENNCNDEQSKQIARLINGLGDWRNEELALMAQAFE